MDDQLFDPGFFFTAPQQDLLSSLKRVFEPELERLKRAYSIRDTSSTKIPSPSPSQILYGVDYDEVNRTLVGILALRWIHKNEYETFVASQPDPVRLTRDSFTWLRDCIARAPDLPLLITAVMINDLGKDSTLVSDLCKLTGDETATANHDDVLLRAVQHDMVPAIARLSPSQHADLVHGLELGAVFNYGQLAQAENAPASLKVLTRFRGRPEATATHFAEQLLDVAGAAGHMDWTGARKIIEPIAQAYRVTHDVVAEIIEGQLRPREGYDMVLHRRGVLLASRGFRQLELEDKDDRALLRILCMGGVADQDAASMFEGTWKSLDEETHRCLVKTLNADGSLQEPVVQPTYMPALLTQAVDINNQSKSREAKVEALRSALRYLARVMTLNEKSQGRAVVERNVLDVVQQVIQSQQFQEDPTILERTDIPRD